MNGPRIHRLLRLITLLQSGRARSVRDLMSELDVSRRTLFRDLNVLQEAGVPYYHDPDIGYRIKESFFLPPVSLSIPETLGLLVLAKAARAFRSGPLLGSAVSAINKLLTSVPPAIRTACAQIMANISVDAGPQSLVSGEGKYYALLQRCIDERRACRVRYESPAERTALEFELEPYALHFSAMAWYVLGRTDVHDGVRVLKLVRIQSLAPLDRFFRRPTKFSPAQKLGKAWRLLPEGRLYDIELEFSPKVAMNVSEVRWHPTQRVRLLATGGCILSFQVDGLNEIAWWICGYADQVIVRKPEALRQRVTQMLASALRQYSERPT